MDRKCSDVHREGGQDCLLGRESGYRRICYVLCSEDINTNFSTMRATDRRGAAPGRSRHWSRQLQSTVGLLVVASSALSACSDGLLFRADRSVEVVEPADRSTVDTPVTVRWTAEGLPDDQRYAVFVDRDPIGVGQSLESLAAGDRACEQNPDCPDERYLAVLDVVVTADTEVAIDKFRKLSSIQSNHAVNIILVDSEGIRPTEAQWRVEFKLQNEPG